MRRDIAIRVENLGKQYRIGQQRVPNKSLRDVFADTATYPLRRLRSAMRGEEQAQKNNTFWALRNVFFEVKHGEVVGIIGRNGAGKSTLLKLLTRITNPTEGRIEMNGRVASLLEVGTGFHPELTGRENTYMNGAILGMTKREIASKFDEIVAFAEIEKFLDTPVKRYSSGMYVRLAFAVAAHLEPEILLVDEVLAVGDIQFQRKCLGKMGDVARGGRTVLFVSHNMGAVRQLCQRGLLLREGELETTAPVDVCIDKYLSSGRQQGGLITDHLQVKNPLVNIDNISINGCHLDLLELPSDADRLRIEIEGSLSSALPLEIEAEIGDMYGTTLATFSPRFKHGDGTSTIPAGPFTLIREIVLPEMVRQGAYLLSLDINDPGHSIVASIPQAAKIDMHGTVTPSGRVFQYGSGTGWILLSD